jgi:hypothetical protein
MKRALLIATLLITIQSVKAQTGTTNSTGFKAKETDAQQKILDKGKNYDVNFDIANHEAFFLEGEDSLFRYIYSRIIVSKEAADANLVSNAMIGFQVNFDGKLKEVYSISKVGFGIDEQLIKELSAVNFVPATQGSIPYRSEVVLEIPIKASYLFNIAAKKQ